MTIGSDDSGLKNQEQAEHRVNEKEMGKSGEGYAPTLLERLHRGIEGAFLQLFNLPLNKLCMPPFFPLQKVLADFSCHSIWISQVYPSYAYLFI